MVACFTDDALYHNMPMEPVQGTDAIRGVLEGLFGMSEQIQWDLIHVATRNGAVLTERLDKFKIGEHWIELPVMGVFEVADTGIAVWRDYLISPSSRARWRRSAAANPGAQFRIVHVSTCPRCKPRGHCRTRRSRVSRAGCGDRWTVFRS